MGSYPCVPHLFKTRKKTTMNRRSASRSLFAKSGESCPKSGLWESVGIFTSQIIISKNELMPLYAGRIVIWKLLYEC